jgi:hypothetical protein
MTTTDWTPVDLDEAQKLCDEATREPWGWRGYDDGSIELRALHSGGLRIITTIRSESCVAETDDGALVLLRGACASCRRGYVAADIDEMQRCEKPENLNTVWAWSEQGFIKPLNEWAVREQPYRADVAEVTHPDARFVARSRELLPRLVAEVGAARAADARLSALAERSYFGSRRGSKERAFAEAVVRILNEAAGVDRVEIEEGA